MDETQDWGGNHLDKDLLIEDNKEYSPTTCLFIRKMVNSFLVDGKASRGKYLLGCYKDEINKKFKAQCKNPFTGKTESLGRFTSELEAHKTWKMRKQELAIQLAESSLVVDEIVREALINRYKEK